MTASLTLDALEVLAVLGVIAFAVLVAIGVALLLAAFAPRSWIHGACRLLAIPVVGPEHLDVPEGHRFVDQAARFGVFEIPEPDEQETDR